jgi:hypothetical protein
MYLDQSPPRFIFQGNKVYMSGQDALSATEEELDEFITLMKVAALVERNFPEINLNNFHVLRLSRYVTNLHYGLNKELKLKKYVDEGSKFRCYIGLSVEDQLFVYYPLKK